MPTGSRRRRTMGKNDDVGSGSTEPFFVTKLGFSTNTRCRQVARSRMGHACKGECIQPEGTESQFGVQRSGEAGDGNGRDHVRAWLGPAGGLAKGNRLLRFFEV